MSDTNLSTFLTQWGGQVKNLIEPAVESNHVITWKRLESRQNSYTNFTYMETGNGEIATVDSLNYRPYEFHLYFSYKNTAPSSDNIICCSTVEEGMCSLDNPSLYELSVESKTVHAYFNISMYYDSVDEVVVSVDGSEYTLRF